MKNQKIQQKPKITCQGVLHCGRQAQLEQIVDRSVLSLYLQGRVDNKGDKDV